jgi:3-hydroxybutyryl-CoA dehydrogenase
MGAGIAQVAAQAGLEVLLFDVAPGPLEAGLGRIRSGLDRFVQKGRLSAADRDAAMDRITATTLLDDFRSAELVIEAVPEVLDLKLQIFRQLDRICGPEAILATNTSSLSVTEIAAATGRQEKVAGMHFFNPVPLMALVEVVSGARTAPETARQVTALALALGKRPVKAKDTPGFIVNRIARPFPGEALRLLGEGTATPAQIDRIARLAAGFRMGPFELMDLVGMDVNYAVNRSVFEQFFYEPRFRPHPLQSQMVKANLLGRKTGAGWYRYEGGEIVGGPAPAVFSAPGGRAPRPSEFASVFVAGDEAMTRLVAEAGYSLADSPAEADVLVLDSGMPHACKETALVLVEASRACTTEVALRFRSPDRVVGYGGIPSVADRQLVEVAPGIRTAQSATEQAEQFFHSLGCDTEVVQDAPGLVAPRLIACLANEATYALMESVADAADIDAAMKLGVNYPHGPLEWADAIGSDVVRVLLEHLQRQTGEDRYRPSPLLRKVAMAGLKFGERHV